MITPSERRVRIEFRALGALELKDSDGRELRAIMTRSKRLALLSYLAFARPRGFHRRDSLVALLWPELDHDHARGALRQALHYLRDALGRDVVAARGDEDIGLNAELISCDAVSFEDLADQGACEEALRIYRGDLMPGFHLAEAPDFEQWLDAERERLRRKAAGTAWRLAGEEEKKGNARTSCSALPPHMTSFCNNTLTTTRFDSAWPARCSHSGDTTTR